MALLLPRQELGVQETTNRPRRVVVVVSSVVQRVGPRRHEPLGDAVAHVDLLPAAASRRRQRHRLRPVVVVVVVAAMMPHGPAAAPEVQAVAPGGRRRVRAARVAHAGQQRVGCGRLGRRVQRGNGEDEQGRHEEEAKAPAPRRHHGCGRVRLSDREARPPASWFLGRTLEGQLDE
jgi:hypothetical protein